MSGNDVGGKRQEGFIGHGGVSLWISWPVSNKSERLVGEVLQPLQVFSNPLRVGWLVFSVLKRWLWDYPDPGDDTGGSEDFDGHGDFALGLSLTAIWCFILKKRS
jgi:hypothetical protein